MSDNPTTPLTAAELTSLERELTTIWLGHAIHPGQIRRLVAMARRAERLEAFARAQRPRHEPLCQEYVDTGSTCHCGTGEDQEYFDQQLAALTPPQTEETG